MMDGSTGETTGATLRKSLWRRILSRIRAWQADIGKLLEPEGGVDSVAFSISFIALSAKLAKADGRVTRDEVRMFRRIFSIPPSEEANVARIYDLCRQNVSGFQSYARKMHRALGTGEDADAIRRDVLDGLFHIAMADGEFHPSEEAFLEEVAAIFGIPDAAYQAILSQHVPDRADPFAVLGLDGSAGMEDIKAARRRLVRENHPDRLVARGLPEEMVVLANERMIAINAAFEEACRIFEARSEQASPDF